MPSYSSSSRWLFALAAFVVGLCLSLWYQIPPGVQASTTTTSTHAAATTTAARHGPVPVESKTTNEKTKETVIWEHNFPNHSLDTIADRLLSQEFFGQRILQQANGYQQVQVGPWETTTKNKNDDSILQRRKVEFTMPQKVMAFLSIPKMGKGRETTKESTTSAKRVFGEHFVVRRDDQQFVLHERTTTPNIPFFGKLFAAWLEVRVTATGPSACTLHMATRVEFFPSPPWLADKIEAGVAKGARPFAERMTRVLEQ